MKIYFAGSIRGGRQDQALYADIIQLLIRYGTVLTEHIGAADVENIEKHLSDQEIYERDISWVKQADILVAEVTTTSLGVGYEIGLAESLKKPILCLYRPSPDRKLSAMLIGNSKITVVEYNNIEDLPSIFNSVIVKHAVGYAPAPHP